MARRGPWRRRRQRLRPCSPVNFESTFILPSWKKRLLSCDFGGFRFQFALRDLAVPSNLECYPVAGTYLTVRSHHGIFGLERLSVVRAAFDSYSSVHRGARRADQPQST